MHQISESSQASPRRSRDSRGRSWSSSGSKRGASMRRANSLANMTLYRSQSPADRVARATTFTGSLIRSLTCSTGHSAEADAADEERASSGFSKSDSVPRTLTAVNKKALQTLCFEDPSYLRGAPFTAVMHHSAKVLGEQDCTEADYELSECVDHIDCFVSHNWSTPRASKFLTLALHFNLFAAYAVSTAIACVPFALTAAGLIETQELPFMGQTIQTGKWCQICGGFSFILALVLWHEAFPVARRFGPVVFLDKTCVNQIDPEMKRKGIMNIAAVLAHSWSMVVLYSDIYLEKLWTVYEIATFLLLFPRGRVHVRPVVLPKLVFPGIVFVSIVRLTSHVLQVIHFPQLEAALWKFGMDADSVDILLQSFAAILPVFAVAAICNWWVQEQDNISERLRDFCIKDAKCQNEDDRKVVEGNVAMFSAHFGFVQPGTAKVEALAMFDSLVQELVPNMLKASFGRTGIPYEYASAFFVIYHFYAMDCLAVQLHHHKKGAVCILAQTVANVLNYVCIGPLGIAACAWLPRCRRALCRNRSRRRCRSFSGELIDNVCWLFGLLVETVIVIAGTQGSMLLLKKITRCSFGTHSLWFIGYSAFLVICTIIVYRPVPCDQPEKRLVEENGFPTVMEGENSSSDESPFGRHMQPIVSGMTPPESAGDCSDRADDHVPEETESSISEEDEEEDSDLEDGPGSLGPLCRGSSIKQLPCLPQFGVC